MSATSYTHVQTIPNAVWEVHHNLNKKVITDVYVVENSVLVKILPISVEYVSDNQVNVAFSTTRTGRVKVV